VSDPRDNSDQLVIRELAAQAIMSYFLLNAEVGNHAANDELIAELARRQREDRHQLGGCPR